MKKQYVILAAILLMGLVPSFISAQNRSITFADTVWKDILAKAKSENKIIFLDAYASWCGPCKFLASQIFTKDSVADFYNQNFINSHYDMEKGEGIELRAKYGVNVFPSLFFINSSGEVVHKAVGSMEAADFIKLGQDALNPEKQLITFTKKYEAGNREPKFILEYLKKLKDSYSDCSAVASAYFANLSDKQLLEKDNWNAIKEFQDKSDSREIKYVIKNKKEFAAAFTEAEVDGKLQPVFLNEFNRFLRDKTLDQAAYDSVKEKIRATGYDKADEIFVITDYSLYKREKNIDKFFPAAEKMLKGNNENAEMLNDAAWTIYENTSDKDKLTVAAQWAKKGIEVKKTSAIVDTYANILFKLGNKEEAIKNEEEAIEIAKTEKTSVEGYQKTLDEMKK